MEELFESVDDPFVDGVKYALENLEEVYGEGIKLTDLWIEYFGEDND